MNLHIQSIQKTIKKIGWFCGIIIITGGLLMWIKSDFPRSNPNTSPIASKQPAIQGDTFTLKPGAKEVSWTPTGHKYRWEGYAHGDNMCIHLRILLKDGTYYQFDEIDSDNWTNITDKKLKSLPAPYLINKIECKVPAGYSASTMCFINI